MNAPTKIPNISVTTGPIQGYRKIYLEHPGDPSIRVPMRRIDLEPSAEEPPYLAYDPSGPYTDDAVKTDIQKGLPRLREGWIRARGDVPHLLSVLLEEVRIARCELDDAIECIALPLHFLLFGRPCEGESRFGCREAADQLVAEKSFGVGLRFTR